jgi:hypothetical protein
MDDSCRTELLKAFSLHPSLRSLDLNICTLPHSDLKKRREFTEAVANMLSVNDRVEVMSFRDSTFDKDDWDAFVVRRLDCNVYSEMVSFDLKN